MKASQSLLQLWQFGKGDVLILWFQSRDEAPGGLQGLYSVGLYVPARKASRIDPMTALRDE